MCPTESPIKKFDLEERTFQFSCGVRNFLNSETTISSDDKKQLVRSSGSVAANYIEANEAISPRDFLLRIRICRKESKESYFWLRLITEDKNVNNHVRSSELMDEALQLSKIFGAIVNKCQKKIN